MWSHVLIVLGFLAYLPYSKHLHIITAAPNVYFAKNAPARHLEPLEIDLEGPEAGHPLGVATAEDLSTQAAARPLQLHGVRPVPGGLPRLEHGQAALARSC